MLEIYFDGVLLDPINYMELNQKWTMFDKEFKLGGTPSREFDLTIPKSAFNPNTQNVLIRYNNEDYAHLIIDKITYNEDGYTPKVKLVLVDKMINANFNYDASGLVPCTVKDILEDICDKMGVELGNTTFPNHSLVVEEYDNTIQAREYISYIAELAGAFARIESDGKLWLRNFIRTVPPTVVNPDLCEKIIVGEKHKVERVVFDNGIIKLQTSDDETLETLYLNPSNVYIDGETEFNIIANKILNFEYYNLNTGNTYILTNVMCGDILKLTYENVDYYTIANTPNLKFLGVWSGGYQLNVNSPKQSETKVIDNKEVIKSLKIKQNKLTGEISIWSGKIGDAETEIGNLKLDSRSISSRVSGLENGHYVYKLTEDQNYEDDKNYYALVNEEYVLLVVGTDYNVGDAIPADSVYEQEWVVGVDDLNKTVNQIQSTFVEQTNSAIITWFNSSGIQSALSGINDTLYGENGYGAYIRQSIFTGYLHTTDISVTSGKTYYIKNANGTYSPVSNPTTANIKNYYEYYTNIPYIELGKQNSQTKLRIMPQRIQFLTNEDETAYISNNSLYINESTILVRQQIGHWITVEDENGNLNTYWQD